MIPTKSYIYYWEDSFLKQWIAGLDKIREAEMLCKKFGKLRNEIDEIGMTLCYFSSYTHAINIWATWKALTPSPTLATAKK